MAGGDSAWVPTVPREKIANMYNSPGPSMYVLPALTGGKSHDPRSEKTKLPIFSFGVKHAKLFEDSSPGPKHHPEVNQTRFGKDGTPHYSLFAKAKEHNPFNVPGPGSYTIQNAGPSASASAPKHSFSSRTRLRGSDQNPSANQYTLPDMTARTVVSDKPQAPQYSQRGRSDVGSFSEDLQKTPGPANYQTTDPVIFKNKAPLFSLGARRNHIGDGTVKPGPGAHSPEKVKVVRRSAPTYSFGIRHSDYTTPLLTDVMD